MSSLWFPVFFVLTALVIWAINAHALRWLSRVARLGPRVRRAAALLLFGSLAVTVLGRIIDWTWPDAPLRMPLTIASITQLAVIVSVLLLLPVDLALLARSWLARARARSRDVTAAPAGAGPSDLASPDPTRRALLVQAAAGSAFLIGGSSSLYGVLAGRHDYAIEDVPLAIPGLAKALDGFTIVQLSDVHIGQFVGSAELAAAEDLVKKARPDLIVLTGDLLDHDPRRAGELGRFTRRLEPLSRHGVVAITGNHDFYAGVEATVSALERGGATVLRNHGIVVGGASAGFALLGVDDVWAGRRVAGAGPDLDEAVSSLPELGGSRAAARALPRILLCHNPSYFEVAAGKVALQLSGHTHGGQVNLVVRPADLFLKNGWVAGPYERGGSRLYVNRGFGTVGPPARIGAPPEVTRIVLVS
jgi:predicted MPP superfamily phosphohydrolase